MTALKEKKTGISSDIRDRAVLAPMWQPAKRTMKTARTQAKIGMARMGMKAPHDRSETMKKEAR